MTTATLAPLRTPKVYESIAKVQAALASEGIAKGRKNVQQNYSFRGIDDIYASLAPLLSQYGLVIMPKVLERTVEQVTNKNGTLLFYTTLLIEYDFISVEDGSKYTARVMGEAMDSGDKSTNKAMSAAYKYMALQAFCIPTEGDNDADATTHEVAQRQITKASHTNPIDAFVMHGETLGWEKHQLFNYVVSRYKHAPAKLTSEELDNALLEIENLNKESY